MQIRGLMTSFTQPSFIASTKMSYLSHFSAETNETWQTNSSAADTLTRIITLCYHGN